MVDRYHVVAVYEKIKRITIPLDENLLFISVTNEPLKKTRENYGNIIEMGKIMSIVDFAKSSQ